MNIFLITILLAFFADQSKTQRLDYFLVGSVDDEVPRRQTTFFVRQGETLKLHLVLKRGDEFFTSVDSFYSDGTLVKVFSNKTFRPTKTSWYQIQPVLKEYSNLWTKGNIEENNVHLEPILYKKSLIKKTNNLPALDFVNIVEKDSFGTYYFTAEIEVSGKLLSSINFPSFSATFSLHNKFAHKIVQIVYRKDDTYVGYLSELLNTPFVIAPRFTDDGYHQTDTRIGSDCAAFAIYGKRRQGFDIPYLGPKWIHKYLIESPKYTFMPSEEIGTEVYVAENGELARVGTNGIEVGDIIHFGEQVSVFYRDAGIEGILDKDDLVFQCFKTAPHLTTIEKSGFYHLPIRLFKWKE